MKNPFDAILSGDENTIPPEKEVNAGVGKVNIEAQEIMVAVDPDPRDPNPTGPNAKTWQHLLYISFHFALFNDPATIKDNSKNKNIYPLLKSLRTAGADVIVTNSEIGYKLLPGKIPQREWDTEIKPRWLKPNHENLLECLKQAKRVAELKLLTGGGEVMGPEMVSEAEAAFAAPDAGPGGAERRRLVFGVDSAKANRKQG